MKLRSLPILHILALLVLCIGPDVSRASHFAAADLSVDYVGANANDLTYKVTLTVYKYCEPGVQTVDLYASETIAVNSQALNLQRIKTFPGSMEDTLDMLCPVFSPDNSCRMPSSFYPGLTRRTYTDTLTLPGRAGDIIFSWSDGSRNGAIQNMLDPTVRNIYLECGINNTQRVNVSSPRYLGTPMPFLCVNQPEIFYNLPLDPDRDSLVTRSRTPQDFVNNDIPYSVPYTALNPLPSPYYFVDTATGTARFTVMNTGKYLLSFRTAKYDRATGLQLAYTTRDVFLSVLPCTSPRPVQDTPARVTGGTVNAARELVVVQGTPLSFDLSAHAADTANILTLSAANLSAFNGATFTTGASSGGSITGHFSWTPAISDTGLHQLVVNATDTTCSPDQPILQRSTATVNIRVLARGVGIRGTAASGVGVFPNPVQGTLQINTGEEKLLSVSLRDMTGRVMPVSLSASGHEMDLRLLPAGMYLLSVQHSGGKAIQRIIKN